MTEHICKFTKERLHRLEPAASGEFLESRIVRARFCECGRYRVSDRRADVGLVRSPRRPAAADRATQVCFSLPDSEQAVIRALVRLARPAGSAAAAEDTSEPDLPESGPAGQLHCSVNALLRSAPPAQAKLTTLNALFSRLAREGLFDLVYRRQGLTRPLELREVLVTPAIAEALAEALRVRRPGAIDHQMLTFIEGVSRRLAALVDRLEVRPWADLAGRHREAIEGGLSPDMTGGPEGAVIAKGGTRKYRQLWLALTEALEASARGEEMPLRELSVRVTGDSKSLAALRSDLDRLGVNLEEWGVYEHQPILRAVGPVDYELPGGRGAVRLGAACPNVVRLDAVADYACLTLKTVSDLRVTRHEADAILIVENLTPFEALAREDRPPAGRVLMLYAGGFIGRAETALLHKVLAARPIPGFIWTDLDLGGHRIFVAVERIFKEHGIPLTRVGSTPEFIDGAAAGIPLTAEERMELEHLLTRGSLPAGEAEWIKSILALGAKVEQEAQMGGLARLRESLLHQLSLTAP